jgi:hypothetical protein
MSEPKKLPSLLIDHARFMIVLAKLKELELSDNAEFKEPELSQIISELEKKENKDKKLAKKLEHLKRQRGDDRSVKRLIESLRLYTLFDENTCVEINKNDWEECFCGSNKEKETPLNTIYQCRNFYALEAPNNLVQRLGNLLDQSNSKDGFVASKDRESKYDRYIKRWGEYALRLVKDANGGLENFLAAKSLSDIADIWVGGYPPDQKESADHHNSFVKRILYLERDRYVQVLTSTVALLWPLWFLKHPEHIQVLEKVDQFEKKNKNFRLGKTLPESRLFIDINTHVGQMEGLPYPFGVADEIMADKNHTGNGNIYKYGDPWPAWAQEIVAIGLVNSFWMPPLLLGVRGGQFIRQPDTAVNSIIPFITLSRNCDVFTSFYLNKNALGKKLEDIIFGCEPGSHGHRVIYGALKKDKKLTYNFIPLTRIETVSDFQKAHRGDQKADFFPFFFPLDLMIQIDENYQRLSKFNLYQYYQKDGDYFKNNFPACLLFGGAFLSRQPKSTELIVDLAIYLQKVEAIVSYLSPEWESLNSKFETLKSNLTSTTKKYAAELIATSCEDTSRWKDLITKEVFVENEEKVKASMEGQGIVIKENLLADWFKHIGKDMSEILFRSSDSETIKVKDAFNEEFENWGWAMLLEFVQYTSIYISCDLF